MVQRKQKKTKTTNRFTLFVLLIVFLAAIVLQRIADNGRTDIFQEKLTLLLDDKRVTNLSVDQLEIPAPLTNRKERLLKRKGYTVSYNDDLKIPNWVAWELTAKKTKGRFNRTDEFLPDPDLPEKVRSLDADYYRSRYDRGHMAPAGDMKWSEQAMTESFYFSNICPQAPKLNRGDWRELEETCRRWANRNGNLYIVCGPVLKEGVRHKRIGKGKVTVPDGFFKVILLMGEQPYAVGFLYPNDDCNQPLADYAVTVDSVETVTGIDFYPALPDDIENYVEAINAIEHFIK